MVGFNDNTEDEDVTTVAEPAANLTEEGLVTREEKALNITHNYMLGAMAAALVPIPLFDMAAVTAVQVKMLHSLARNYDIPFTSQIGKSIIGALIAGVGVPEGGRKLAGLALASVPRTLVKSLPASVAKFLPGLGTVVGVVGMPVLAGAATYALGKVFIQHFEAGGTFLDFRPGEVREHFQKLVKQGQALAEQKKAEVAGA